MMKYIYAVSYLGVVGIDQWEVGISEVIAHGSIANFEAIENISHLIARKQGLNGTVTPIAFHLLRVEDDDAGD